MNASQDRYKDSRLKCLHRADCMRRNSLLINVQTIYQKLRNSNGNTFSFIPHVCYFSYLSWITASKGLGLTTLFSTKMMWEEIARRTSTPVSHSIRVPSLLSSPPLPSAKTIKNLESRRKFSIRDTYIDGGLCIFLVQMLKTVSISFINIQLVRKLYSGWLLSNL